MAQDRSSRAKGKCFFQEVRCLAGGVEMSSADATRCKAWQDIMVAKTNKVEALIIRKI